MALILGKYEFVASDNFEQFMKDLSRSIDENIVLITKSKPILEIRQDGEKYAISVSSDGKSTTSSFKLNEFYDEYLPFVRSTYLSRTVSDGNKLTTETLLMNDVKFFRIYEFTEAGVVVHLSMTNSDVKGTRTYKRI